MIKAEIFRNKSGLICGFKVDDHADSIVCSAVSALTLNCVNCIDEFTDCKFDFDYNESGGFLHFVATDIANGEFDHDADLIFNCLLLGLSGIESEYGDDIKIFDTEV